jgi:chemotaxis signal transduction protein
VRSEVPRALIPFTIQQTWIALEAAFVREILGERRWVSVRCPQPQIRGLVGWQGRAIALFDLGMLGRGLQPLKEDERRRRTLVVDVDDATLAVPVDNVMEVEEIEDSALRLCQMTKLAHCATEVELRGIPMPLLNLSDALKGILGAVRTV